MPNETKMSPAARHNARYYAIQAMYQWQIAATPLIEIEAVFLQNHIDKKTDVDYFKLILHAVPAHQAELDAAMKPYLGRLLEEIDPIELAVLRVATYELIHRIDVPYRVVINEALELTKQFGSIEGFKFVNGVLDRVARKTRELEVQKHQSSK